MEKKGGQGPAKGPMFDAAENRHAWVKGSVVAVVGVEDMYPQRASQRPWEGPCTAKTKCRKFKL